MTIRYDGWLDISANVPTNALPLTPKALWLSNDPRGKIGGVHLDALRIFLFSFAGLFLFFFLRNLFFNKTFLERIILKFVIFNFKIIAEE